MSTRKLFLIVLIFGVASIAWVVLGRSVAMRTRDSAATLGADVDRMYGPRIAQASPRVTWPAAGDGARSEAAPTSSEIVVTLDHEDRYRGLVWFSVYRVAFEGIYTFAPLPNPTGSGDAWFEMELPGDATIDALEVTADGEDVAVDDARIRVPLRPGGTEPVRIRVAYASSGQEVWEYLPGKEARGLRDFRLTVRTNFEEIDYPKTGLSPTTRARPLPGGGDGRVAEWAYERMLPARNHTIGIVMPTKPAAGELSARLSQFAPVSLFFFFVVLVMIQLIRNWKLHPMNYLLVAAGFFAFHILLAYLVDHVPIHGAFWIAAAVSVFLVVSYLRLVLGGRQAILVAGGAQLVYLVFFSYAFFWQGWTGLTVVIGAVLTLFVIMQLTGRIDWDEKFPELVRRRAPAPPPLAPVAATAEEPPGTGSAPA